MGKCSPHRHKWPLLTIKVSVFWTSKDIIHVCQRSNHILEKTESNKLDLALQMFLISANVKLSCFNLNHRLFLDKLMNIII